MSKFKKIGTILLSFVLMLCMGINAYALDVTFPGDSTPTSVTSSSVVVDTGSYSLIIHKYKVGNLANFEIPATGEEVPDTTIIGKSGTMDAGTTLGDLAPHEGVVYSIIEVERDTLDPVTGATMYYGITDSTGELEFTGLKQATYKIMEYSVADDGTATTTNDFFYVSNPINVNGTELTTVHVYPKNQDPGPDIVKEIDMSTINGTNIPWSIQVAIPDDIKDYSSMVISDTLDSRTTYVPGSLVVYYTDRDGNGSATTTNLTAGAGDDYTVSTPSGNAGTITVTLTAAGFTKLANALLPSLGTSAPMLYIKYNTVVTLTASQLENIETNPITNNAELDFRNSKDYRDKKETGDTTDDLYGILISKRTGDDNNQPLPGAEFELYYDSACTKPVQVANSSGVLVTIKVTTGLDGLARIYGLAEGTYYLKETKAPNGYSKPTSPFTVVVASDEADSMSRLVYISIQNEKGFLLPITGGTGTLLFKAGGLLLIGSACVILVVTKKKNGKTIKV